jgi:hypothetical protein
VKDARVRLRQLRGVAGDDHREAIKDAQRLELLALLLLQAIGDDAERPSLSASSTGITSSNSRQFAS